MVFIANGRCAQEMVFIDLDINSWSFWVILFFDVTMLIARDADLWEDLAAMIYKGCGKCGGRGHKMSGRDGQHARCARAGARPACEL